jgi:hypothetical protein
MAGAGCGEVKERPMALPDAAVTSPGDAAEPDAMVVPDAPPAPANINISSVINFPTPNIKLEDFTPVALQAVGMTGSGFNQGGGGVGGNPDAPTANGFAGISGPGQIAIFTFASPVHAVGMSTMDIDFGNDNSVIVTVAGFDADSKLVASFQQALSPANTGPEENAGARFVGWKTAASVVTVRVSIDQNNSTMLDNLVFQH